jgi:hypothetical protein
MIKAILLEVNLLMDPQSGLNLKINRINTLCLFTNIGSRQATKSTCGLIKTVNEESLLSKGEYNLYSDNNGRPKGSNSYGLRNIIVLQNQCNS